MARAFALLGDRDVVLGPAPDGGYWLIGLRCSRLGMPATALQGVRWSSPHARMDTEASLRPLRIGHADLLADVDTLDDLRRLSP